LHLRERASLTTGERMNHRIYFGDSREVLLELAGELKEKVALVVTSPPYFVNREYELYLNNWEEYLKLLDIVFSRCVPLLEPWGKIAINFADKYANAKEFGRPLEISYVPFYVDIMNRVGMDLWARIIWNKNRPMLDAARHLTQKSRFEGQMRVSPSWEYIFVWRKYSKGAQLKPKQLNMSKEEWSQYVHGVWNFSSVADNIIVEGSKQATFPEELPKRLITMYTAREDIILDPFVGTGTTIKVARDLGRVGIGIEKNKSLEDILRLRLQPNLFDQDAVEFIHTDNSS